MARPGPVRAGPDDARAAGRRGTGEVAWRGAGGPPVRVAGVLAEHDSGGAFKHGFGGIGVTAPAEGGGQQLAVRQRVLVVDDDPTVSDVLCRYLERAGYEVTQAADGLAALERFARDQPDLVVLDLMLPGIDGLEVCRRLHQDGSQVPVIMLTALGREADRVLGLQLGADDYVAKPFSPRELVLRVQSVLRRAGAAATPSGGRAQTLIDGDLVVDTGRRLARLSGTELALTIREFDLLAFLMRHPARAFRRAQLLEAVWGWDFGDQSTVTVHVRRLREKVEADPARPRRIVTVWGVGYRYEPGSTSA